MTDSLWELKLLGLAVAVFATAFTLTGVPDINEALSIYFAGMASGVAASLWLEEEENG